MIKIVVDPPCQRVNDTMRASLRRAVRRDLEEGRGVISHSGESLAAAVEWCEEKGRPYRIEALPGTGYSLTVAPTFQGRRRSSPRTT